MLSLFAVVFARLMNLERAASANYNDGSRARLAARAGVSRAIAEMRRVAGLRPYSDPWQDNWGFWLQAPGALPPVEPLNLLTTTLPSFANTDNPDPQAPQPMFWGEPLAYSGYLGSAGYADGSALLYKLKILDTASGVNVNHADAISAERMVKNLLKASLGLPDVEATGYASTLLAARPMGGFETKAQLAVILMAPGASTPGLSEPQWATVQDQLMIHGWLDTKVIRPWNLNQVSQRSLLTQPRPPINLNTASQAVITAMFAETRAQTPLGEFVLDYASAERVAQAIVARRGIPPFGTVPFAPFRTWNDFESYIDVLPPATFSSATWTPPAGGAVDRVPQGGLYHTMINLKVGHKDLVKAIANPNTMLTKFGLMPNHGGYQNRVPRLVDKSDLVDMTTEGCLDAMGIFEITSLGLVMIPEVKIPDMGMRVIAAHTEQMVVELYRVVRLSSQQDFEAHRAMHVDGNTIPIADQSWGYRRAAMNKAVYYDRPDMPLEGWPGVVSWPNYSLERELTPMKPTTLPHPAADSGGHLTLTNLIGVKTSDADFMAGFARGRLEAFKGRAYWDPRFEDPSGARTSTTPTHPADATELTQITTPMTGINDADTNTVQSPRLRSKTNPTQALVLDEFLSLGQTTVNAQGLFTDGSSLLNTGVMISPERLNASGQPQFLAFDGDNLDLTRGTSIRFWVQPLLDPYSRQEEVMLSFVGSQDGTQRQAGFRVYKEALANGAVSIVLEAVGGISNDSSGLPVDWNWATGKGGATPRIEVDVTPIAPYDPDPINPQWIPGSWHWVVVNIGPGRTGFDSQTEFFASLQVDKRKAGGNLVYKGNRETPTGLHEYGELHGHALGENSDFEPLMPSNVNTTRARGWIMPRQLGDYYHCMAQGQTAVITKEIEFGELGAPPAVVFTGAPIPYFPYAIAGEPAGVYVTGASWPPTIYWPILSFNHRLTLNANDPATGGLATSLSMTRDSNGIWSIDLPHERHEFYGPDDPVARPKIEILTSGRQVIPARTVTNGYPGDKEYHISLLQEWDEAHYTVGCPECNLDTSYPSDLTQLPSVEEPTGAPMFGEPMPYSHHNSGPTFKSGMFPPAHPFTLFRSWVRTKTSLDHPQGREPNFPSGPPSRFPITYIDDDCHGCEACDVDGPVFIGGEPSGNANYSGGTTLAPVNPATMAAAVFDNIVIRNGDQAKRTDWPGANRAPGPTDPVTNQPTNYANPGKDFEDRFFESNMSTALEGAANFTGYGVVYHRGLFELDGVRARLGTVSWTAYPTTGGQKFELGIWSLKSGDWSPTNPNLIPDVTAPTWGFEEDPSIGIALSQNGVPVRFDGIGDPNATPTPIQPDLLVVGLRLRDMSGRTGVGPPIPAPLLETPVFEDLTITFIPDVHTILHAEQGVLE